MTMKRIVNKLRAKRGESLVEVLCAILIFTLSSVAMYSMVMAASSINATAKEAEQTNLEQMLVAEKAEGDGANGTVTMTVITPGGAVSTTVNVEIYGADGELYSYFKAGTGGTGGS